MVAFVDNLSQARKSMVGNQIVARDITDPLVLSAMHVVPREIFVPQLLREFAYEDAPLPIEAGQTISQPYIVARMIELAELGPEDRVLEIGAGSRPMLERAIGVIYRPESELASHYFEAEPAQQSMPGSGSKRPTPCPPRVTRASGANLTCSPSVSKTGG